MTTNSRKELLDALRKRYCYANKKERIEILENLIQTTGYSRKHAITLLNNSQQTFDPKKKRSKKQAWVGGTRSTHTDLARLK
ncbi:MAG: hypothetical protein IPG59_05555 [Candidatus Melainabacteria bacterium]|nr:MAG: hypothetical protein IPG59_03605 [Candidatus Melainabacteria bacterium]QQR58958.1 MAG: hypothetical protein IPG59_05555 [Candidatus Melainabacteria bacterium]